MTLVLVKVYCCIHTVFIYLFSYVLSFCIFFFSSRRRHTRCALVTGVQTCALPISSRHRNEIAAKEDALHIAEGKKRVCQRRDFCFLWSREIARAGLHDLAAGKEFERRRIGRHFGCYEHEQY